MNDKMIEEMAKVMAENWFNETIISTAERLINAGYRKIPEGSVVLDRQEHQKYCAYKIIEPQIKGCLDRGRELERKLKELEEQRDRQAYIAEDLIQEKHRWTEQARKETAEKFAKAIKTKLEEISSCGLIDESISILNGYINEIAKQFGVKEQK